MSVVSGIVVFLILWWLALFAVLPWGVRPSAQPEPGHDPGAPERPRLWRKALLTTGVAVILWLGVYALVASDLISFREMARQMR